jgi:hypothetical protein
MPGAIFRTKVRSTNLSLLCGWQTFDTRNKDAAVDFQEFLDFVMKKPVTLVDLEESSIERLMWIARRAVLRVGINDSVSHTILPYGHMIMIWWCIENTYGQLANL